MFKDHSYSFVFKDHSYSFVFTVGVTNMEDVEMHSIRSGAAMAMYLGECPVFMIMLIGCWSSDAFLRYIRKQVLTKGLILRSEKINKT